MILHWVDRIIWISKIVLVSIIIVSPFFLGWLGIRLRFLHKSNKQIVMKRELKFSLFVFYFLLLYQVTVFRFGLTYSGKLIKPLIGVNVHLLTETIKIFHGSITVFLYNVIGNMVWFIPLGMMLPALFFRWQSLKKIALTGFCVSLSIEVLQFLFHTGVSDIDDVLFNVMGAIVGFLLYKITSNNGGDI